jgi:hypothetical protein
MACRAQVYHDVPGPQDKCFSAALGQARSIERMFIKSGQLVRTQSHAECFSADNEGSIVFYLPEFMRVSLGADSVSVVDYDVVDGVATQRVLGVAK